VFRWREGAAASVSCRCIPLVGGLVGLDDGGLSVGGVWGGLPWRSKM